MSGTVSLKAGFVLHQRPYRETSTLTDLFTESEGRVTVVARGVRGAQRKGKQCNLSPFRPYLLDWVGRGDLPNLKTADAASPPHALAGDALYAGIYANELLLRLCTRHDPHPVIYQAYLKLLVRLEHDAHNIDVAMRYFERDLLQELGYGLGLEFDSVHGEAIDPALRYAYDAEKGARALTGQDREAQAGYAGATLLALQKEELSDPQQRLEARKLLRMVIRQILGERPLKSLETLKRIKQIGRNSQQNQVI